MTPSRWISVAFVSSVFGTPLVASAWETAGHIHFGNQIATPFEEKIFKGEVPVIAARNNGPHTFGHWVSAPDFGRGLLNFFFESPNVGDLACAALWTSDGVGSDDDKFDDQTFAEDTAAAQADPLKKRALLDCADVWRVNNNHFGDFAARQYHYYHRLALEAAERYRRTRQKNCREAAYTLEGWGQHHLTDSTASGHAWNPPGSYDNTEGLVTWTGPQIRMRIHNFLNQRGANMAKPLFEAGTFYGDHSEDFNASGKPVYAEEGSAQRELTLRLARMGLGQVVAAAECGGTGDTLGIFMSQDENADPRRVLVSNQSMCAAMYGHEIWRLVPSAVNIFGVNDPGLAALINQCREGHGMLAERVDGFELAASYFSDRVSLENGGNVSIAIDPESAVELDQLGCHADRVVPLGAQKTDVCGHALCEVPQDSEGRCPADLVAAAGCCYPPVVSTGEPEGEIEASRWASTSDGHRVEVLTPGAYPGDASEFIWFKDGAHAASSPEFGALAESTATRLSGEQDRIVDCGRFGSFSVFESQVRLPAGATKSISLTISDMDEGLRIQVNGQLVRFVSRFEVEKQTTDGSFEPVTVELFGAAMPASPDGTYHVRLTHLNDCGDERPLEVRLSAQAKTDVAGAAQDLEENEAKAGGCAVSGNSASPSLWIFAAVALAFWIRRKRGQAHA